MASANINDEFNLKNFPLAYVMDDDSFTELRTFLHNATSQERRVYNKNDELFTTTYRYINEIAPGLLETPYYGIYEEYETQTELDYIKKVAPNYVHYFDYVSGSDNNQLIKKGDYEIFCWDTFNNSQIVGGYNGRWFENGVELGTEHYPPLSVSNVLTFTRSTAGSKSAHICINIVNRSLTSAYGIGLNSYGGGSDSGYVFIVGLAASFLSTSLLPNIAEDLDLEIGDIPTDPYELGGGEESDTGGGGGSWDDTSDPIDYTPKPNFNVVDTGFVKLYNPDITMIKALADYMWNPVTWDPSTWQNLFADPMDAILGLNLVPVTVPNGATTLVTVGNMSTSVGMPPVTEQFVEVDCGTIDIAEYWGSYLDYAPYTKVQIYLPYCGIHEISADEIMGKTIGVQYVVDVLSGACRAEVKCGESVLYQFLGQCAASIPTSGRDWGTMINGVITAAVSIGSMVATGGMAAPLAAGNLASAAVNVIKPSIEKSGAMSGPGGLLCRPVPYLIMTLPVQCVPGNQNKFTGYPSYITRNLGGLSGYTEVESVHLHGIPGTDEEINEIERLLKEGVIL